MSRATVIAGPEKDKDTMATPSSPAEPDGGSPHAGWAGPDVSEYLQPPGRHGISARAIAALVLVTGLWLAVSPRFLTPQQGGTNVAAEVIIGIVVAGIGTLALVSRRGLPGRRFAMLVLGVWAVLGSSFASAHRLPTATALHWSDTWSGALLAVLALAQLSAPHRATR